MYNMLKSSDYRLFCHLFQLLFTLLHIHVCEKKKYSKTLFVLKNTLILQSLLITKLKNTAVVSWLNYSLFLKI